MLFNFVPILFLGAGLFFIYQKTAVADNAGHLLISQVQISGDKASYDFVEFFNPTNNAINLKNYKLIKRTKDNATEYLIKSWSREKDMFMPAGSYFLWANNEYEKYASAYLFIDSVTSSNISINNGVDLRKNDTNETVDSLTWGESQNSNVFPVNPEPNQGLERKNKGSYPNAIDTNNDANDFILVASHPRNSQSAYAAVEEVISPVTATVTGEITVVPTITTAGEQSIVQPAANEGVKISITPTATPSLITYPQNVRINEFLPDPEGRDDEGEWIEVFNNSGQAVNLNGWQLDDETGKGSNSYKIPETVIKPLGYVVFPYKQTKITLNNDMGEINLIVPNGQLRQKVAYVKAPTGESYNYFNDGWRWCKITTPLGENDKCEASGKAVDNSRNNDSSGKLAVSRGIEDPKENGVINSIADNSKKTVTASPQTKNSSKKDGGFAVVPQKKKSKAAVGSINNATTGDKAEEKEDILFGEDNSNAAGKGLKNSALASPLRTLEKNGKKPSIIPYVFLVSGLGMFFALGSMKAKEFFNRRNKNISALDK